jgi:hypothetical protein
MQAAQPGQMAGRLGSKIEQDVTKAKSTLSEQAAKTGQAIKAQQDARTSTTGAASVGLTDITSSVTGEAPKIEDSTLAVSTGLQQEYKGPQEIEGKQDLAAQAVKLEGIAKSTGTEAGRTSLVDRYSKAKRSAGQTAFDAAMLTASRDALKGLASQSLKGKTFGAELGKVSTDVAREAQTEKAATAQDVQKLQAELGEKSGKFQTDLEAAVDAENTRRAGTEVIKDKAELTAALVKQGLLRLNSQGFYESTVPGINTRVLLEEGAGLLTEDAGRVDNTNLSDAALLRQNALRELQGIKQPIVADKAAKTENTYAWGAEGDVGERISNYVRDAKHANIYDQAKDFRAKFGDRADAVAAIVPGTDNSVLDHIRISSKAFKRGMLSGRDHPDWGRATAILGEDMIKGAENSLKLKGFGAVPPYPKQKPGEMKGLYVARQAAWNAQHGAALQRELAAQVAQAALDVAEANKGTAAKYTQDKEFRQSSLGNLAKFAT